MSEATPTTIDALLAEQKYISPPESFVRQANVRDASVYDRFDDFPDGFAEYAEMLTWDEPWEEVLDASDPPFFKWFTDGKLNVCFNCVDRHLDDRGDEPALVWEGEDGASRTITYRQLHRRVNETAALLLEAGVGEDDVVTLHLPMLPALPITMLACARIGAPHSVVFGGFSAQALATRIDDAGSRFVVTCDGYYRRGEFLAHKKKADEALELADTEVDALLVWPRHGEVLHEGTYMKDGRDHVIPELLSEVAGAEVEPVSRDAEDVLFLMYTSGTTGTPKGVQHRTGGYLAYAVGTSRYVLDIKPEDVYWCAADIGWITGHTYIVYGPLALGTTSVMYEGAPDHPHKGRLWEIAERYGVDVFHTSPTAVRMFMKWGEKFPERHDFRFRHLTTVGEPIQPEAWLWYWKHIGGERAVVVDTWWQTETGGHLISNLPALEDMKPGSAGRPLPGIEAAIVDDDGREIPAGAGKAGNLVITRPWPGMLQTLYGDDERYIEEYWATFSDTDSDDWRDWVYRTGDGAFLAGDGYYRILGRLDDVMNVAGHRLGTMELESAIVQVEEVAEAAVAPRRDPEKGQVPVAFVILREGVKVKGVVARVVAAVEEEIGPFARPAEVLVVDDLPKTRSGKIMRRLLENIANDEPLGDTTTLRDPDVPVRIRSQVLAAR